MRHGSLFSGIGGFDLAAEWMGWENVFHCEWNPFGQKILKHYWPNAISYEDITKTDFTVHRGNIDILTGGFPCQPYSMAGKRLGKEDDRHLWPEMLRSIREIKPRWVLGENVFGLVNWNGGLVFDEVQSDLEAEGYEVQPYLLPACAVNAPHRRDRIWFVAYANGSSIRANKFRSIRQKNGKISTERTQTIYDAFRSNGIKRSFTDSNSNGLNERNSEYEVNASEGRQYAQRDVEQSNDDGNASDTLCIGRGESWKRGQPEQFNKNGIERRDAADTSSIRFQCERKSTGMGWHGLSFNNAQNDIPNWQNFPTVSPICNGDDGLSSRLDGITFSKWRNESIKGGGNAVVPQVVFQIFKAIEQYETQTPLPA